jgi:hypothetical protein
MLRSTTVCLFFSLAAIGCGDNAPEHPGNPDAGTAHGPDANPGCPDPTAALPYEWRPIDQVTTGAVVVTPGAITEAAIDATAGGVTAAAENPYVYLDLEHEGVRVNITDVESYGSSAWDIALKREVIRVNGGDSGPGGVSVAVVAGATGLDAVATSPPDAQFATDDWASDQCALHAGPLGEPQTALGDWYTYDVNTHTVTPKEQVMVIKLRDGTKRKLRIETYYGDAANPMAGAHYKVQWAVL